MENNLYILDQTVLWTLCFPVKVSLKINIENIRLKYIKYEWGNFNLSNYKKKTKFKNILF